MGALIPNGVPRIRGCFHDCTSWRRERTRLHAASKQKVCTILRESCMIVMTPPVAWYTYWAVLVGTVRQYSYGVAQNCCRDLQCRLATCMEPLAPAQPAAMGSGVLCITPIDAPPVDEGFDVDALLGSVQPTSVQPAAAAMCD